MVTGLQFEHLKSLLRDRYVLEREGPGRGPFFTFAALDATDDTPVTLYVFHHQLWYHTIPTRVHREIEILGRLQHENIVPVIDWGMDHAEHLLYYAVPRLDGERLRERLDREGGIRLDECLQIVRDIGKGLGYAHSQEVIHRDLTPFNIFLQQTRALLTDFSLAEAAYEADMDNFDRTEVIVGTPGYMSPERIPLTSPLDERSDIYEFGCVVYEMLAGEPPFAGSDLRFTLARHLRETPPTLKRVRPKIPRHVRKAIEKALAKEPEKRHQTVEAFLVALGV